MGSAAGKALLIVLAAIALGATIRDPMARIKTAGGALLLFVLYAWWREDLDVGRGLFLWLFMFFTPFSFGGWMQRKVGKKS